MNNNDLLNAKGLNTNPLTGKPYSDEYKTLAKFWSKLPAYDHAREIIQILKENQVTLVRSSTGSGKTLLIPKFMLHVYDYKGKIAVTLPKQIITKSAAEFSARISDIKVGQEIGYRYKGVNISSDKTRLLYATDGTIISMLFKDPKLSEFDAVIMDEIHERSTQIDFLIYLLRNTLQMRPEFKLILMSATVDEKLFESYFYNFKFKTIYLAGEPTFPIDDIYLDRSISDKDYLEYGYDIIKKIDSTTTEGDILFFVTSVSETLKVCDDVRSEISDNFCVQVFAGMNVDQQELAQEKDKYKTVTGKKRKIVVSTNVAESSLTIKGIKYVIDCGYELSSYYDPQLRAKVLDKQLISRSSAIQRRGRTGRTGPGVCYHLYTKDDFENRMPEYPEPEIRTSNIYDECLRFLHLPDVRDVAHLLDILSNFIEPPREVYIRSAITQLMQLGLVQREVITPLGDLVAELRMDPMQGVAIALGYKLKCAREVAAIFSVIDASKSSIGELFNKPSTLKDINPGALRKINDRYTNAKKKLLNRYGDHLSILKIFILYTKYRKKDNKQALEEWCYKHFLKRSVLDKSYKYYQKVRNHIRNVMSKFDLSSILSVETSELEKLKLEYKIMISIAYGFRLNIANLGSTKYRINRDSFMYYTDLQNMKDYIVYDELFSSSGRIEFNIVSRFPSNIHRTLDNII